MDHGVTVRRSIRDHVKPPNLVTGVAERTGPASEDPATDRIRSPIGRALPNAPQLKLADREHDPQDQLADCRARIEVAACIEHDAAGLLDLLDRGGRQRGYARSDRDGRR